MRVRRGGGLRAAIFSSALKTLTVGLAVLAAAAILGLGGAFSATLDWLNHFTPIYFFAALLLAVRALFSSSGRWPLLALGVAGSLSAAVLLVPEWRADQPRPHLGPAERLTIKLLTQNVWEDNPRANSTAAQIVETGADVVVLEEAKGAGRDVAARVSAHYPYQADCTALSPWCALAIFSKRPILAWSYHIGAWRAPDWDRVGLVRATIDGGPAGPFEVIGVQLMHPDRIGEQQAREFADMIAADDRPTTIVAGDFNRTPWSFSLRRIESRLAMVRRTHGLSTWPRRFPTKDGGFWSPFPFVALDQVYAGSAWRTLSIRRGPATGSDHYGVLATLAHQ